MVMVAVCGLGKPTVVVMAAGGIVIKTGTHGCGSVLCMIIIFTPDLYFHSNSIAQSVHNIHCEKVHSVDETSKC